MSIEENSINWLQDGERASAEVLNRPLKQVVNAFNTNLNSVIGVYKNVENKTIGASGDFRTIQEAFTYAQTHQKQALAQRLTLTLLQDFNQELYFSGAWYPHLVINCNGFSLGSKVIIDLSCFSIENLKLSDNIIISNSIFWFSGNNININYQNQKIELEIIIL